MIVLPSPAAPTKVAVEGFEELGGPPLQSRQTYAPEGWADVVADQALVGDPGRDRDLVPGEPPVEEGTEAGLGAGRLPGVGLREHSGQRPLGLAPGGSRVAQDDAFPVAGSSPAVTRI